LPASVLALIGIGCVGAVCSDDENSNDDFDDNNDNGQTASVDLGEIKPFVGRSYPLCCHKAQQMHVIWGRQMPQYF
jgi:hypothetical protein